MKKLLSLLLSLLMLLGGALAETLTPANTPITIDGVRVAFFDNQGNYLSPMAKDGLVYAPLAALCENLGKEAQAQGQSVLVDGIRVGMFDSAGNFLVPVEMNGVAYVPVIPFCESIGVEAVEMDGKIEIVRAQPAKAAEPVEEKLPETMKVPLTSYNFNDYFSWDITAENFKCWDTKLQFSDGVVPMQSWSVDYVLTVTALTGHPFENVRFTVFHYGNDALREYGVYGATFSGLVMPQSGQLNQTEACEGSYLGYRMITSSSGLLSFLPNDKGVSSVSGTITLPYEEGRQALKDLYAQGILLMEQEDYKGAEQLFNRLGDYEDSAQQAQEAKAGLAAQKQAEKAAQEEEHRQAYDAAVAALEAGDYETAQSGFSALAGVGYKDSAQKLQEARNKKAEADRRAAYDAAAQLEADGDFAAAYDAFIALGEYQDSAQRAKQLAQRKTIQEAEALMAEDKFASYTAAAKLLQTVGENEQARQLLLTCNLRTARPEQGVTPEGTFYYLRLDGRGYGFMDIQGNDLVEEPLCSMNPGDWQDGLSRIMGANKLWGYVDRQGSLAIPAQYTEAQHFYQGKALVKKNDKAYIIDPAGETLAELPAKKGRTYLAYVGEDLVSYKENDKRGLMDLTSKVILKPKYTYTLNRFEHGLAVACNRKGTKDTYAVINTKGKEVLKLGKVVRPQILSENLLVAELGKKQQLGIINTKGKTVLQEAANRHAIRREGDWILVWENSDTWSLYDLELQPVLTETCDWIQVGYESQIIAMKKNDGIQLYHISDMKKPLLEKGAAEIILSPDSPYVALRYSETGGWFIWDCVNNVLY